jgi:hypothetical protein
MDLVQLVEDEFATHEFYAWSPLSFARPTQLTTTPIRKWAWDGLPFYKASFLYTAAGSDPNHHKAGEWLFEVTLDADSVDFSTIRGEPDAAKFPDASLTATTLKLVAWQCVEDGHFNWFHDLWNKGEWPESDAVAFLQPAFPVRSLSLTVPLEDLGGRDAAVAFVWKFKQAIQTQLNIASSGEPAM